MASLIHVTGVKAVVAKLQRYKVAQGVATHKNLMKAGRYIQRESQMIVPVDTGNLKNTAFTRNVGGPGLLADVIVGYTAEYAIYVHEDPNAAHKEGKTHKFLEKVIREKRVQILRIIGGRT